ncbi:MAG TPA: XdhC family protein, partial [Anaerolineales bacterium]|nr:XdhC family protein [Anaerolineales bacterium]
MTIYQSLAHLEATGFPCILCTVIASQGSTPRHAGSKMLVYPDGRIEGTIGGGELESRVVQAAREALVEGKPRTLEFAMVDPQRGDPGVCGGMMTVFIEPVLPPPTILVIGAGHVGRAVVHLAHWLGFRVVVSDDRAEFCTPEVTPGADMYLPVPMVEIPEKIPMTPHHYVILTTRNVMVDVPGLPALLATPAAYIGIIGSKRRWLITQEKLREAGVPETQLSRVVSPIGLALNAETPEEIA